MGPSWLTTLGPKDTLPHDPRSTIVPAPAAETARRRALEALSRLRDDAPIRLEQTLGQGGMGVVHLATQPALDRKVAVKTVRSDRRGDTATLDLLREAWITGRLEHPNIVPVYDLGVEADGSPLVVYKRIEGVTWSAVMHDAEALAQRGETDLLEWNLGILLHVINAVRFAHRCGILHRDLKPDNVMIGGFGEVYLLDWGIAVSLRDDGSGRLPLAAEHHDTAGTPCYMAPEMLEGSEHPLSEATDLYLLGSILYEILAGRPPHHGRTVGEIIDCIRDSRPPMPADAPRELAQICRRLMDPDPRGRFERAEQVRLALVAYLKHRGSEQLARHAEQRLGELLGLLEKPPEDPAYRLFGECRFGFREALAAWPQNEAAAEGMRTAIVAMAEAELAAGQPRAAATLLAEVRHPPALLATRIDQALAAEEAERRRRAELELLRHDLDLSVGQVTRTWIIIVLGLGWTLAPLLGEIFETRPLYATYPGMVFWGVAFAVVLGAIGLVARRPIMATAINRRLFATTMLVLGGQSTLGVGLWVMGTPILHAQVMSIFLWSVASSMIAIAMERRLAAAAAAQWLCFLAAARWPAARFYFMAAANAALTINAVVIWHSWRRKYK